MFVTREKLCYLLCSWKIIFAFFPHRPLSLRPTPVPDRDQHIAQTLSPNGAPRSRCLFFVPPKTRRLEEIKSSRPLGWERSSGKEQETTHFIFYFRGYRNWHDRRRTGSRGRRRRQSSTWRPQGATRRRRRSRVTTPSVTPWRSSKVWTRVWTPVWRPAFSHAPATLLRITPELPTPTTLPSPIPPLKTCPPNFSWFSVNLRLNLWNDWPRD